MTAALDCFEGKRDGVFRRMTEVMRGKLKGQGMGDLKLIQDNYEIPIDEMFHLIYGDDLIKYSLFKRLSSHFGISIHEVLGELMTEQCDVKYWQEAQKKYPILSAALLPDCNTLDKEEQDSVDFENYIVLRAIEELVWSD